MNEVERALYARLAGGTTLVAMLAGTAAIYNQLAPEGAAYPYVRFAHMTGTDDNETPHRARSLVYLVEGISRVGLPQAGSIDAAADALLHLAPLSVSGWSANFWIARESDVRMADFDATDRTRYYRSGGLYRVRIAQ